MHASEYQSPIQVSEH